MNIHFLSFLFDIAVWIIVGIAIGKVVYLSDVVRKEGNVKILITYSLIAVIVGMFVVLGNGLPEQGFALDDSLYVIVAMSFYALCTSSHVRKHILRSHKATKTNFMSGSYMSKGGELHGNYR
jgi:hypothetical protein